MSPIRRDAPVQRLAVDEAVATALGDDDPVYGRLASKRQRARNMTPGQRKRAQRDAQRVKYTYDLPEEIGQAVERYARESGIPQSQMAAVLLLHGLLAQARKQIDLRQFGKRPSRSPRYDWVVEIPEIADFLRWCDARNV